MSLESNRNLLLYRDWTPVDAMESKKVIEPPQTPADWQRSRWILLCVLIAAYALCTILLGALEYFSYRSIVDGTPYLKNPDDLERLQRLEKIPRYLALASVVGLLIGAVGLWRFPPSRAETLTRRRVVIAVMVLLPIIWLISALLVEGTANNASCEAGTPGCSGV